MKIIIITLGILAHAAFFWAVLHTFKKREDALDREAGIVTDDE